MLRHCCVPPCCEVVVSMRGLLVFLGLIGVEAFTVSPSSALRRCQFSRATSSMKAMGCRRGRNTSMGTDFEDDNAKEKLRAMLNRQFGIGDTSRPEEWCKATDTLQAGTVLLADPSSFTGKGDQKMLGKFGLAQPLPGGDQIPADRTGVLMGDLGEDFKSFMIQPLWLGGTQGDKSLSFIHSYPEVLGAQPILEDQGLYFAGEIESASRVVSDGPGSSFNFRFFVQFTLWGPGELAREVERGLWRPAIASKMALLRVRDRKGPDVAKPMWSDLSQMAGGDYLRTMEDFYRR